MKNECDHQYVKLSEIAPTPDGGRYNNVHLMTFSNWSGDILAAMIPYVCKRCNECKMMYEVRNEK